MSKISLKHSGGNVVSLNAPTNAPGAADVAFKLPNNDGSDGQALVTDGSGNLSFTSVSGAGKARNLIINGAFQVAQYGVSSTSVGYQTCDRWYLAFGGTDEAPEQRRANLGAGDAPYELGFPTAYKITNGNQTSGAGASDYIVFITSLEAQDIANSGWNYKSASSYITLSFWAKSSVAKTFDVKLTTNDGTPQQFNHKFTLAQDTWTKVTKAIPGNSNLVFDNNASKGVEIQWDMYSGTNYTSGSTVDQWVTYNGNTSAPDETADWYTTNDATFELTAVQLEVGNVATDFEHRSFGEMLGLCQRYFFTNSSAYFPSPMAMQFEFPTTMRAAPTITHGHSGSPQMYNITQYGFNGYSSGNSQGPYYASAEL
tara:strand:+ start:1091 stop:2200 length:1110 start_codon:yes stop_codon:yes gene_type:complete